MTRTLKIRDGNVVRSKASGRLQFVEDKPKAEQALRRLLALDLPNGAGLDGLVGTVPEDEFALSADVQRNIRAAFNARVETERQFQLASRTPNERFARIQQMYVVPAEFPGLGGPSKTGYAFRVDAVTVAGESITSGGALFPPEG